MSTQKNSNCELLVTPRTKKEISEFTRFLKSEAAPAKLILQNGEETIISESIYQLLKNIFQAMDSGKSVSLSRPENFVTTQDAAKILKVSHSNFMELMKLARIPLTQVDLEYKVALKNLIDYKKQQDENREKLLDEIMEISQDTGFYE